MAYHPALALSRYKKLVARLERTLTRQNQRLLQIPAQYGFKSVKEFITALKAAEKQSPPASASSHKVKQSKASRRKRARITPETKALVQSLVKSGKTGVEIAKQARISLPSVANIKRELGLTSKKKSPLK